MAKKSTNRISIIIFCIIFGGILALCFLSLYHGMTTIENYKERNVHILTYTLMIIICFGLFCSMLILSVGARLIGVTLHNIWSEFVKQDGSYPTSSNDLFTGFFLLLLSEIFFTLYSEIGAQTFRYISLAFFVVYFASSLIYFISTYFQLSQNASVSMKIKYTRSSMRAMIIGLFLLLVTNQYVVGFIYNNLLVSKNTALLIVICFIVLCYFLAVSFCQFSNLYCFLGVIFDNKDSHKIRKNLDNCKQRNTNRKKILLNEINKIDSTSDKQGIFIKCKGLIRLGISSLKSYFQGRGYMIAYLFLLAIKRINDFFANLLEEEKIRTNVKRFCAITIVAELIILDIFLFTFLGSENSCTRFYELLSTVIIIPILLSALLNLRTSKHKI